MSTAGPLRAINVTKTGGNIWSTYPCASTHLPSPNPVVPLWGKGHPQQYECLLL